MIQEFEGRTEKEAIDLAVDSLGLNRDEFDVEIMETQKSGLFNLSKKVRIRVHTKDEVSPKPARTAPRAQTVQTGSYNPEPENDFEHAIVDFNPPTTEKM